MTLETAAEWLPEQQCTHQDTPTGHGVTRGLSLRRQAESAEEGSLAPPQNLNHEAESTFSDGIAWQPALLWPSALLTEGSGELCSEVTHPDMA